MAGQVAVALFETTFALHARTDLGMGLVQIGVVLMVCGLMMLVVQLGAVSRLAGRSGEVHLASAAFALMGLSPALLALARSTAIVLLLVASYGIGASVAVPISLASGLLLGLAPIFAWSGRRTHDPPNGCAAKGKLAFRRQEAR